MHLQTISYNAAAGRASGRSARCVAMRAEGGKQGREPWDVGRFVSTVAFFNPNLVQRSLQGIVDNLAKAINNKPAVPAVEQLSVASPPSTQAPSSLPSVVAVPVEGVILVTGATGGLGRRVVSQLLAAGKTVRALVKDKEQGQRLLAGLPAGPGGGLQLVAADLTQPTSLKPDMFTDVRAVISCAALDTDTSSSQGAAAQEVQNLLTALGPRLGMKQGVSVLQGDGSGPVWGALDDVVWEV